MTKARFLIEYIKHPKTLGTFIESWPALIKGILNEIKGKKIILELGAGTGPISKKVLKHLPEDGFLRSVEIIPELYEHLKKIKNNRFEPILGNAENINNLTKDKTFDCIISGLPLSLMSEQSLSNLLSFIKKKKITFIQYKYKDESELLSRYFNNIKKIKVWKKFPLAVIYVCNN